MRWCRGEYAKFNVPLDTFGHFVEEWRQFVPVQCINHTWLNRGTSDIYLVVVAESFVGKSEVNLASISHDHQILHDLPTTSSRD